MEVPDPVPYKEAYPKGSTVRIADREFLKHFRDTWNYHDNLTAEQLDFGGATAVVEAVGYYFGGDPLYTLRAVPGLWHEQCIRKL